MYAVEVHTLRHTIFYVFSVPHQSLLTGVDLSASSRQHH